MDRQKTILWNSALLSATHPLRKITKPLSSPLEVSEDFFGETDAEKATLFQRLLSPHPHPLKNHYNRGGDDRQVSQNGMPFCTGCTLFGHILNLPEGLRPLGTPIWLSENKTAKHPLEVSPFHFRIRWGMYLSHLIDVSRCFREALSKLCDLCPWQIISGIVQIAFLQVSLAGRKFVKHMPDFWKNHWWNFCRLIFCLRSMFLLWYCRASGRKQHLVDILNKDKWFWQKLRNCIHSFLSPYAKNYLEKKGMIFYA